MRRLLGCSVNLSSFIFIFARTSSRVPAEEARGLRHQPLAHGVSPDGAGEESPPPWLGG